MSETPKISLSQEPENLQAHIDKALQLPDPGGALLHGIRRAL